MAFLLALLLGLMSATGFAPLGLWPVTIVCLALLTMGVRRAETGGRALLLGYAFGLGQFVLGLNWIAGAFRYQDAMPVWLGWIAVVALSIYLAVYPAAAAWLAWRFRARAVPYLLAWSAAWIATEYLRATLFTGFAWNPLAAIAAGGQGRQVLLGGALPWLGTYGLSGLLMALGCALGLALTLGRQRPALPVAMALTLLALVTLPAPPASIGLGPLVRVVQPNVGQRDQQNEAYERVNFDKLAGFTGRLGGQPRLILWPEAAVPWYLEEQPSARETVAEILGPRDIVLLGGDALIFNRASEVIGARNSVFVLTPAAELKGRYDKAHLVPYGEYLPMRPLLSAIGLSRIVPGDLDFWPGPGPKTLSVPGFGRVGFQLCYEIIFSGQVVERANRPAMLFNPSDDSWFGAWGPPQHLAQARLRAAEEGLPVVRSTPTGISAVIDAHGRLLAALPLGKAGFIETRLPAPQPPTLFARLGNALPLGLAALLAVAAVALLRRAR